MLLLVAVLLAMMGLLVRELYKEPKRCTYRSKASSAVAGPGLGEKGLHHTNGATRIT